MDIAGFGGSVDISAFDFGMNVLEWSGALLNEVFKIPAGWGQNWHDHTAGPATFVGSLRAKVCTTKAPIHFPTGSESWSDVVEGSATLTASASHSISGNFVFSNFTISRPHNGVCVVSCDLVNKDDGLSVTWT